MPHANVTAPAEYLREYLRDSSPNDTGRLRRNWRVNIGRNIATVYNRLPWAWRARGDNKANRNAVANGIRQARRRYTGWTYSTRQTQGRVTITIRHA